MSRDKALAAGATCWLAPLDGSWEGSMNPDRKQFLHLAAALPMVSRPV